MSAGKRVLVTGASGFVGRHIIPELLARGYEVHAVSRKPVSTALPGIVPHQLDIADVNSMRAAIRDISPSHLVHLAWDVTPGAYWSSPVNRDWIEYSLNLYRVFAMQGGKRAMFAGTCAEYDWTDGWLDEANTPLRPTTIYGAAKGALREAVLAAAEEDCVSVAWAHLFMLFGPHERAERLVPYVARALLQGQPALCGDGASERDFLHVADVAAALACVLDSNHRGAINIASGVCVPLGEVIGKIATLTGRPDLVRLGARAAAPGDPPRLAADAALLHDGLGFQPRFDLAAGLADAVDWWRLELMRPSSSR